MPLLSPTSALVERLDTALARGRVRRSSPYRSGTPSEATVRGLEKIRHIVVLMMENHSYDNYFGMLMGRGEGFALGPGGEPLDPHDNRGPDGRPVTLRHAASPRQFDGSPSQSWTASHEQWNGGRCDGFVTSTRARTAERQGAGMRYWGEQELPFYYGLARTFPLATRWFCSCLGPTFPNRRFLIAGTAHGLMDDVLWGLTGQPPAGTVLDLLSAAGVSWANFHNKPRGRSLAKSLCGPRSVSAGRRIGLAVAGLVPGLAAAARGELQFTADLYPMDPVQKFRHALSLDAFFEQAGLGTLPAFSIVDPDYGRFSEEDPQDVQVGESFAAEVVRAVMDGPGWPGTVLFWLYDEHGGYYDHVAPPSAVPPDGVLASSLPERHPWLRRLPFLRSTIEEIDADDRGPRTYDRYGFRVPAVVVSPFARRDFETATVFDHTSILKFVEQRFGLPSLTRRDAAAVAPLETLDLLGVPPFLTPPALPDPATPGAWRRYLQ